LCLLDITRSTDKIGLIYFINTATYVIFTLLGGFLGDNLSRRKILFVSDFGRGLIVLLMIAALSMKSLPLIYLTSFLLSVLGSLHRPVKICSWTKSISNNDFERYNSLSELSLQMISILGPLIASYFIVNSCTN